MPQRAVVAYFSLPQYKGIFFYKINRSFSKMLIFDVYSENLFPEGQKREINFPTTIILAESHPLCK
jgi:hypothetical protein